MGMPWGIVLELHGWWHILTAISSYTFMAMIEFLTCPENDENYALGFKWPAKAVLEDLVPKQVFEKTLNGDVYSNGHLNGAVSKKQA